MEPRLRHFNHSTGLVSGLSIERNGSSLARLGILGQRVTCVLSRLYTTILTSQVDCVEAIYNLGLVNIHLGLPGDSLQAFEKLHTIIPNNTEVIYHIANLYEVRKPNEDRVVPDLGQELLCPPLIYSLNVPVVCDRRRTCA